MISAVKETRWMERKGKEVKREGGREGGELNRWGGRIDGWMRSMGRSLGEVG